jgi:hypothetical protein
MPEGRLPAMAYRARVTLTVAGALVLLLAAWRVRNILLLVLVAAVLAVGLDPQVRWLQGPARFRRRRCRAGADQAPRRRAARHRHGPLRQRLLHREFGGRGLAPGDLLPPRRCG